MMLYVLICLCLALVGVAGLQFTYMFYLERLDQERKKRLYELEHECAHLTRRLREAEKQIAEQEELIRTYNFDNEEEIWADVIEDR